MIGPVEWRQEDGVVSSPTSSGYTEKKIKIKKKKKYTTSWNWLNSSSSKGVKYTVPFQPKEREQAKLKSCTYFLFLSNPAFIFFMRSIGSPISQQFQASKHLLSWNPSRPWEGPWQWIIQLIFLRKFAKERYIVVKISVPLCISTQNSPLSHIP